MSTHENFCKGQFSLWKMRSIRHLSLLWFSLSLFLRWWPELSCWSKTSIVLCFTVPRRQKHINIETIDGCRMNFNYKKKFVVHQKASSEMGMRERERGGGGGRGHERRARKRTGWKVHIESKTQMCWLTSVLAIDVHENALTAQDTSVSRTHLSSARLEKSDAWPASGHSFYDEPWTPANCHVRALTWAPTASISARQSHLLHLQSPLFGYVPRSGGENVKETTWTNKHTSPDGEGKEEEGREEKRGEGRRYSVSLRRKTGQTEAGWVEGSINSQYGGKSAQLCLWFNVDLPASSFSSSSLVTPATSPPPPPPPPLSLIPISDEAFWRTTNFFLYCNKTNKWVEFQLLQ